MKFVVIADTHIGGTDTDGFQQQPRRIERIVDILAALGRAAERENAEFILHVGDICDNGSPEEIRRSAELFATPPVSTYLAPGNHDCRQENPERLRLDNAPDFFPEGSLDSSFVRGGLRFDLLRNARGVDEIRWTPENGMYKLVEFDGATLSMKTIPLADRLDIDFQYRSERSCAQGAEIDRAFGKRLTPK